MSYGTRKAIAGAQKGEKFAHEGCLEAIRRFDACKTQGDIRDVLAWAKDRGGWFLRHKEDSETMLEAFHRAKARCRPV